jgi:serine/threonine-protein kinase RsbT
MNISDPIIATESLPAGGGTATATGGIAHQAAELATEIRVRIDSPADIVAARQHSRSLGKLVGFSPSDLTMIATAISEIARNILEYANDGTISIALVNQNARIGVRVVARDSGPGIPDLESVMRDGYSTDCRLGIGLPGARRLVDEFEIVSIVGQGTTVTMQKWL